MRRSRETPVVAVGKGLLAGMAGTALMTAYQMAVAKLRDSGSSEVPAEVGRRVAEGVFDRDVPDDQMDTLNNAMHVGYGTAWGAAYGLLQGSLEQPPARHGLAFGGFVWGVSLIELPAMKLAPPVWKQPPAEVALDCSYHLVYGLGVAGAYSLLAR